MTQKKTWKRRVFLILTLAWAVVIFGFSAQPAGDSSQISGGVSYRVVETADHIFGWNMTTEEQMMWAEKIEYPIRKAAHMTEYAIFAVLVLLTMGCGENVMKSCALALAITAGYAATDEVHQLFVSGRSGRVTDVLIDSAGALTGLLITATVIKLSRRRRDK